MDHTIHVGDCMEMMACMPSDSVDAILADPPYGISFQSNWAGEGPRFEAIHGDDEPCHEFIGDAVRLLRCGGAMLVFCEWRFQEVFRTAISSAGATIRSQCIWDRMAHGMGNLDASFAPCHDVAWFATKGDGFRFHAGRPQSVLRFPRVPAKDLLHPCEKPVQMLRHLVTRLCPPGGLVLDPFCGVGSVGVACALEGRSSISCEISPSYADIATKRINAAANGSDWKNPRQATLFSQ